MIEIIMPEPGEKLSSDNCPGFVPEDHPAFCALNRFVQAGPHHYVEVWKFIETLPCDFDQQNYLMMLAMWTGSPVHFNELALAGRIKMYRGPAGDIPVDPWRSVGAKLTFRDLKDGTATLVDVFNADRALDREDARHQKPEQLPAPAPEAEIANNKAGGGGKTRAVDMALEMLNKGGVGPPHRGRLIEIATTIAMELGLKSDYVRNAIRLYVREWEAEHPKR